jgi:glycosyltransferase involved in cell wall biosynthesis
MVSPIKVSLIFTIKNEEETIQFLLDSILNQIRQPDEIVIVDGGSIDSTVEIIESYRGKLPIKLIICPKANIAQGRNIAIRNTKNEIICATDGGCYLAPDWLAELTKPMEEQIDVDVISGVYAPWCKTKFEEIAAHLLFPKIGTLKVSTFQPSARSILFKKKAWAEVGGFPEQLLTAEDTVFDLELRKKGMKFELAKEAVVYWRVRNTTYDIFKQFYKYTKSDGLIFLYPERYVTRVFGVAFIFLCLLVFWNNPLFYLIVFIFGLVGFWIKYLKRLEKYSYMNLIIGTKVALAIETGLIIGYLQGMLERILKRFKR